MKRSLSFGDRLELLLVVAGTCLIAGTYGLVRLAYGLFLPDIAASVAMSTAVAGYVASAASAAYCLGALAAVVVDHRPRTLVVAAVATASGGALAMAMADGLALLAPAVVVASAGAGLASPGLVAVVARGVAAPRTAAAQATVNAGTGPGLVAAGLLALALPDWRAAFVASAVVTAAAGAGVLLLDRRGQARPAEEVADEQATGGLRWMLALRVPAAGALLLGAASAATWTYGRTQVAATGAGSTETVLAWIALGVGGTATVLTARRLGALPPARAWLLTALVVAVATAGLAPTTAPLLLPVLACGAFGWGFVAASSALIAWAGDLVADRAAAGTSVLFVALVLGQAAGAAAAGALAGRIGLPPVFLLAAGVAVLAAACGATRSRDTATTVRMDATMGS
ncbi:MFS transporter [Nocardioides sp. zg-1308]|uniref:MFS transporter n=1 Tax=Nocardioides sp. zg-1308 TaxID=2736253 RepID=UPI0015531E40|nr:MFS transporter [Nocardioides sp. zg-1308]NPD03182.1 MFS transporter [Nocardioides sp. zg-1308]